MSERKYGLYVVTYESLEYVVSSSLGSIWPSLPSSALIPQIYLILPVKHLSEQLELIQLLPRINAPFAGLVVVIFIRKTLGWVESLVYGILDSAMSSLNERKAPAFRLFHLNSILKCIPRRLESM